MAWVRLEDDFALNPKIVALSDGAFRLYVVTLCYANRFLTDGYVPEPVLSQLIRGATKRITKELLASGVWTVTRGGYRIHDYEQYQPLRADVLARRADRARAGRAGGLAKAKADAIANAKANATAEAMPRPRPRTQASLEASTRTNEENGMDFRGILKRIPS